jgi:threonine-phosphate decarboxylase
MEYHGGNIYEHNRRVIDFSSNINPLGVPKGFEKSIADNINKFSVYPDREYMAMRERIAKYLEVNSIDKIIPGNGAVDIIYRALEVMNYSRLYISLPTFAEYKRAGERVNMKVEELDIYDDDFQNIKLDYIFDKVEEKSVVLLCNPNNPTGTLIPRAHIAKLLAKLESMNSFLIIDEAFIEFAPGFKNASMVEFVDKYDNLLIIRAATKFFGMPGIRLGYGVSSNLNLVKKIKDSMEPWSVNTAAEIAAESIFDDQEYIKNTLKWINEERARFYDELSKISSIKVYESSSNFFFINVLDEKIDAYGLQEELLKYDILIRLPKGFNGISRFNFRIAIKDKQSNDLITSALKKILE